MAGERRPEPVVLPGHGVFIPAGMCAALASVLTLVLGRRRPPAVAQRQGGALAAIRDAAHAAAVEHHRMLHHAAAFGHDPSICATANPGLAEIACTAQMPGPSAQEISTSAAAEIGGLTPQRWRQLAAKGDVTAHRPGGRWLLDKASVLDYAMRRTGNGSSDIDSS